MSFDKEAQKAKEAMVMKTITKKRVEGNKKGGGGLDPRRESRLAAIQALIPLGLAAVGEELCKDLLELAGEKHQRDGIGHRWGFNDGSVYLADQKVHVRVPRVRSKTDGQELPLPAYERLQEPGVVEELALKRVINGISTGRYKEAALCVPETFGIARNSVSRKWIRASARKLKALQERSLKKHDFVAMILDGKTFGENEIIIALGITLQGDKVILGFIEANTENFVVCRDYLNGLIGRGLNIDQEILIVIDGGKGLRKAVDVVLGAKAFVQRCQFHKRENVMGYLSKERQSEFKKKLQGAYEENGYAEAREKLLAIRRELKGINLSAVKSLDEGFEETLTLHRLGMFEKLGISLKTTNLLENINGSLERLTGRVCRWRVSDQRQRWVGAALLEIEPGLRRLKGYQHLPTLRLAMKAEARRQNKSELTQAA
jgi:transposase-like protein